MSNSKSSTLTSGAGVADDVWTRIDKAVKAQGGSDEDLHLLAREEGQPVIDQIAGLLVRAGVVIRNDYYQVVIDYSQTIDKLIEAGKCSCRSENITADNFPITGEGRVIAQLVLIHFNRNISSENAIKEMVRMGLEPAKIEHLLAYSTQHWRQQDPRLIVALGSSWAYRRGFHSVPSLENYRGHPYIGLQGFVNDWLRDCRFLALRRPAYPAGRP